MQLIFTENTQIGDLCERGIEYQVSMTTKAHYDPGIKVLVVDIAVTLNHPDLRVDPEHILGIPGENRVLETHNYSALAIRRAVNLTDNMIRRVREAIEEHVRTTRERVERTVREATPGLEVQSS